MNTFLRRALLTVLGAPAAALSVWTLAVPLAGVALTVRGGGGAQTVGPASIVAASLLAGLAAWALLAVLERGTSRPGAFWTTAALTVCVLSLAGPLGGAVGPGATVALLLMHLAVGAVLIPGLPRR